MNRALLLMKDFLWLYIVGSSLFLVCWQVFTQISVTEHIRRMFGDQSLLLFCLAFLFPLFVYTFLQVRWVRVLLAQGL